MNLQLVTFANYYSATSGGHQRNITPMVNISGRSNLRSEDRMFFSGSFFAGSRRLAEFDSQHRDCRRRVE